MFQDHRGVAVLYWPLKKQRGPQGTAVHPYPPAKYELLQGIGVSKDVEALHGLDGYHVPGLEDIEFIRLRAFKGEFYLLRIPSLYVDKVQKDPRSFS